MVINGFSKLSKQEKIKWLAKTYAVDAGAFEAELNTWQHADVPCQKILDGFTENAIANFPLPYSVAPNVMVNGKVYAVPMVIEESSVVAAASSAAKFWLEKGGIGDAFDDTIDGVRGSDWLAGGDGADLIMVGEAGLGVAVVFGGAFGGSDTSTSDTIETAVSNYGFNIFLTSNYITSLTNELIAVLSGIENATGGGINDGLFGSAGANVLDGGDGNDWIVGNGGADTFRFSLASDADGDNIRDFRRSEGDRFDLGQIDANTATTTDDAFVFRTTRTINAAGEAVVINYGTSAVVNLYNNADNTIDGTFVVVYGETAVTSLTALDFLL